MAADADGSDLKDAVITKLKLDAAPNRVRLLLEVQGQAPSPLDSCKSLKEQGIVEGSSVQLELLPRETLVASAPLLCECCCSLPLVQVMPLVLFLISLSFSLFLSFSSGVLMHRAEGQAQQASHQEVLL